MPRCDAHARGSTSRPEGAPDRYLAYLAGGLFTQHDLATNVSMKEAVWRLSSGRFELVLPQSKELRHLDRPDLAAYLRNLDLCELVQADVLIARFDGPEIDTGTVVEFMVAKMLGKASVILRTDSRHLLADGLDDPYNLMVRSWPRTEVVHIDSVMDYVQMMKEAREKLGDDQSGTQVLEAEMAIVGRGIDAVAQRLIEALETVIRRESPYPPELQRIVYEVIRYAPGGGFDQLFSEPLMQATVQRLVESNTL